MKPEIIESIQRAFFAKNMTYTHELVYDHKNVPKSSNNAKIEGGVQKLSETNLETLNKVKSAMPPVILKYDADKGSGFYVVAACDI